MIDTYDNELAASLDTTDMNSAAKSLRVQLRNWMRDHDQMPSVVTIPFAQAQVLRDMRAGADSHVDSLTALQHLLGKSTRLHVLDPVRVVARWQIKMKIPDAPTSAVKALWEHWGYPDGEVNREPLTPDEPLAYGLSRNSLVPAKWPEPVGMQHVSWVLHAGQEQTVTIELMSDGTRRFAREQP